MLNFILKCLSLIESVDMMYYFHQGYITQAIVFSKK